MPQPLCFVLMPFGQKRDPPRPDIDFDRIYREAIEPAVRAADMEPIRADEERTGGIIHKAMFERLLLCDFAVADLSTANANVFYELGVRHAVRPRTTVSIFARHYHLPFDVNFLRALPYALDENNLFSDAEAKTLRDALATKLKEARALVSRQDAVDSPLFQLLHDFKPPEIAHLATDVFRERVEYSEQMRRALASALRPTEGAVDRLRAIEQGLAALDGVESGVLIDLLLSYRDVESFDEMIRFTERLPLALQRTPLVREQLAFALNRRAGKTLRRPEDRERALNILLELERERGANPETSGLIGRIYKDQWREALTAKDTLAARGYLRKMIDAYVRGFEADWRDAYPGVNAVTFLELEGSEESLARKARMVPVVRYAVEQRLRFATPNYWDHATLLELAVLESGQPDPKQRDRVQAQAERHLEDAAATQPPAWYLKTTTDNLDSIREAREARGQDVTWLKVVIAELRKRGSAPGS